MEIDQTTLTDMAILPRQDEPSIFDKLNFCISFGGRAKLHDHFCRPLTTREQICGMQETLRQIQTAKPQWPGQISNGSVMVVEKFFDATIDDIPAHPGVWAALEYKLFHGPDFSYVRYSMEHLFDFLKGMLQLTQLFPNKESAPPLCKLIQSASSLLQARELDLVRNHTRSSEISIRQMLGLAHFIRYRHKHAVHELLDHYYTLDSWYSMATAMETFQLTFPVFTEEEAPVLEIHELIHLLLPQPVAYTIELKKQSNFLFLTGANMAGKSTFIKAIGTAVFLAHAGMGVPAAQMRLSCFDGLLSNINVTDNIVKGESYFYNEVQRIRSTVEKIADGRNWLILIDELFKGTNVQDAMKCSSAVIEGFLKIQQSVFVLSTHLYEIGEPLRRFSNIQFRYFETRVEKDQLHFHYQLKEGISNDRLGYLILKNEGVVKMLEAL